MVPPKLAFIIVNYATPDLVFNTLISLIPQLSAQDEVIVVDNASPDQSAVRIESMIQKRGWAKIVKLVIAPYNGGFSAGNNLGIATAAKRNPDGYWLTNSDTLFQPYAVATMRQAIREHSDMSIFTPQLEYKNGAPQVHTFRFHSPFSELIAGAATSPITKIFSFANVPISVNNTDIRPQWISFASVVITPQLYEAIGPLDEGYFMYYEDVDYCRRASQKNHHIIKVPDCHVVHLRGKSSTVKADTKQRNRRPRYYYASRARYFAKFYTRYGLWLSNIFWLLGYTIARLRETLGHKQPHTCAHEATDIWINWQNPFLRYTVENNG